MTEWYAPNQQAVRGDESGPEEEGSGGAERIEGEGGRGEVAEAASGAPAAPAGPSQPELDYEAMTKEELVELARERGISPANLAMTKDELVEALKGGGR